MQNHIKKYEKKIQHKLMKNIKKKKELTFLNKERNYDEKKFKKVIPRNK
jgi:hypothetical protein